MRLSLNLISFLYDDLLINKPEKSKGSSAAVARLCHWKCWTSFGLLIRFANCGFTAYDNFIVGSIVTRPPAIEMLYIERIEDQWYNDKLFHGGKSTGFSLFNSSVMLLVRSWKNSISRKINKIYCEIYCEQLFVNNETRKKNGKCARYLFI